MGSVELNTIINGDCMEVLKTLPDNFVDVCITSPPYYALRDYGTGKWIGGDPNCPHKRTSKYSVNTITGHKQIDLVGNVGDAIYKTICPVCGAVREDKQIGLEETPEEYINKLVAVFHEVKRCLKDDGTLWLNIGDSYWGSGSRGYDFTGKLTEASQIQGGSKGTINLQNIPKLAGNGEIKNKDLIGIPWMLAFALRSDGWYLRQDIIWHKPNPMPESVKDRCTKSHEYIFLLSKSAHYHFNYEAIQEPAKWGNDKRALEGRIAYDGKRTEGTDTKAQKSFVAFSKKTGIKFGGNKYGENDDPHFATKSGEEWIPQVNEEQIVRNKRDVWSVSPSHIKDGHYATYPEELVEPCILAGSDRDGVVLDPFAGSGTTLRVAERLNRNWLGIELSEEYIHIAERRTNNVQKCLF